MEGDCDVQPAATLERRSGVHTDDFGTGTERRHRLRGYIRDTAVADRCAPSIQAQPGVELHTCVHNGRRDQRRNGREINCRILLFVVAAAGDGQPFGRGMEIGEDLHGVVELHWEANRADGQRVRPYCRIAGRQRNRHLYQERILGHRVVVLQPSAQGKCAGGQKNVRGAASERVADRFHVGQRNRGEGHGPPPGQRRVEHGVRHRPAHRRHRGRHRIGFVRAAHATTQCLQRTRHSLRDQPHASDLVLDDLGHHVGDKRDERRRRAQARLGRHIVGRGVVRTAGQKTPPDGRRAVALLAQNGRHLHRQSPPPAGQAVDAPRFPQRSTAIKGSGAQLRDQVGELTVTARRANRSAVNLRNGIIVVDLGPYGLPHT